MHFLPVDFHDVVHGAAIAGAELVEPRFFHLNKPTCHVHTAPRVRRWLHTAELLKLQRLYRFLYVVVCLRVIRSLVDRNDWIEKLWAPTFAPTIHLPGSYHVGLAGKNENLNRLVRQSRFLTVCDKDSSRQQTDRACKAPYVNRLVSAHKVFAP